MAAHGSPISKEVLAASKYLRNSDSKLKNRDGVLNGRRVYFFKGKSAVNALLRPAYSKTRNPSLNDEKANAVSLLAQLMTSGLILRADRPAHSKVLTIHTKQTFQPDAYYVWMWDPPSIRNTLLGMGIVLVIFAGVLFPIWPPTLRQGVYYLSLASIGLVVLFFVIAVIRLVIWACLALFTGRGGWLFPNLFADVGVIESFQPVWQLDETREERAKRALEKDARRRAAKKAATNKVSGSDGDGSGSAVVGGGGGTATD
ncbi:hypothetical protein SeMB42_g01892 [Synchytrium endobioticum]|uniref:Translocation protein SEC62 n=1 Tax=Synchytrium endobioticum TaxID=286115 RepID=A0A507CRE7_9FUNG|nr:hypothetical protein SeLEV6574_g06005 [Synchytrium endobioticum]TPX51516.1 hypothetical protein SeMB42_g01892 [Synchytrium endobioticum]